MNGFRIGDRYSLSYAYDNTPAGRQVEVVAWPDEDDQVEVRFTESFLVPRELLEKEDGR